MINELFGNPETLIKRKKYLLIDFSAISNATFFINLKDKTIKDQDELLNLWRHSLLTSILKRKKKINPDEIILAIDSYSWRNDYFQYYKAVRKANKTKSDIDFDFFYKASDKLIKEIKAYFPWYVIEKRGAEGDDILAILSNHLHKNNDVVLLTSDKDMVQLLKLNNVKYYSYRDDEYKNIKNPYEVLLRLILSGDKDDGIPNLLSPDNIFVSEGRQKQCGPQKQDKILQQGIDDFLDENPECKENYQRNKKLIELSKQTIPEEVWNEVIDEFENYEKVESDFINILTFFRKNNMKMLQDRIQEFM